ncbi:cytoplasmic protein [Actinoplanes sp. LDG1-06]|uniref:Cytoplasmic protein n=1 Tax=Paractinoplanes ovalisporus TaxID=2810368 RepID=A0ABS2A5U9_9ACTN|nr:cytoplasmic protein [Actinoplanes ovalisporus]MBM2615220.1 cytoplasmic protein [Actinoplanes ovalisporus]
MSSDDPVVTDPGLYRVIFENDRVRVLEYRDKPGDRTHRHRHPDTVMYTLTAFRRRISAGAQSVDVELPAGAVRWVGAQEHSGENTGDTPSHGIFIELKDSAPAPVGGSLGPSPLSTDH